MCEVCRSTPCKSACPNAPKPQVMGYCRMCNSELRSDYTYFRDTMMIFSVLVNVPNFFTALPRKNGQ